MNWSQIVTSSIPAISMTSNITGVSDPEAPTEITLSNKFLLAPVGGMISSGKMVGGLNSVDFNTGNTFTYSLVTGTGSTHNSLFNIVGDSLVEYIYRIITDRSFHLAYKLLSLTTFSV